MSPCLLSLSFDRLAHAFLTVTALAASTQTQLSRSTNTTSARLSLISPSFSSTLYHPTYTNDPVSTCAGALRVPQLADLPKPRVPAFSLKRNLSCRASKPEHLTTFTVDFLESQPKLLDPAFWRKLKSLQTLEVVDLSEAQRFHFSSG